MEYVCSYVNFCMCAALNNKFIIITATTDWPLCVCVQCHRLTCASLRRLCACVRLFTFTTTQSGSCALASFHCLHSIKCHKNDAALAASPAAVYKLWCFPSIRTEHTVSIFTSYHLYQWRIHIEQCRQTCANFQTKSNGFFSGEYFFWAEFSHRNACYWLTLCIFNVLFGLMEFRFQMTSYLLCTPRSWFQAAAVFFPL